MGNKMIVHCYDISPDFNLVQRACEMTMDGGKSRISNEEIYRCEHSPIRTKLFWIEMIDIPTFISVHLVRHKIGVEHFVKTNRDDLGGDGEATRNTPVNHGMLINAQALINMARKRLCGKSHEETRKIMRLIKDAVGAIDEDLPNYMVRECEYRNGICPEKTKCKLYFKG